MKRALPVAYSVLDGAALAQKIAGAYDLVGPVQCTLISPGVNDTYQVTAGGELSICRVYRAGLRSRADIQFELDLLHHLKQEGVAVSVPIPKRDGGWWLELAAPEGARPGVLFSQAPGQVLQYVEADGFKYGQTVARMHKAMDTFVSEHRRFSLDLEHLLEEPLRGIRPFAERQGNWGYLEELAGRLRAQVQGAEADLEKGICHGDLHGHNVHQAEDGALTQFDFDCGGPGYRVYDLAVYRWAVDHHAKKVEPWEAFVRGYRSEREIRQIDLDLVPAFVAIRIFWLLGLQVQQMAQRGTAHVEMFVSGGTRALRVWDESHLLG